MNDDESLARARDLAEQIEAKQQQLRALTEKSRELRLRGEQLRGDKPTPDAQP
jgi:cell division protein FtsB